MRAVAVIGALLIASALALAAGAQWTAQRGLGLARAALDESRDTPRAAAILERVDRLWPARRDAAYERARAALMLGDAQGAIRWLARCRARVPSHLRWSQVAANALVQMDHLREAELALRTAVALNPNAPERDRGGLAELRRRLGEQP